MPKTTIRFLTRGVAPIEVETPLALDVSWGDRVSRTQEGPNVYGSIAGLPYGTRGDLRVEVGPECRWESGPVVVRASIDNYGAEASPEQHAMALETHRLVVAAWQRALVERPDVTAAVEDYRRTLDSIERQYADLYARWRVDAAAIARAFRRARVEIGEQTVPGKVVVRSSRGKILGYANVWDGVWLGTVTRV